MGRRKQGNRELHGETGDGVRGDAENEAQGDTGNGVRGDTDSEVENTGDAGDEVRADRGNEVQGDTDTEVREDTGEEVQEDSFDPLLREIARDSNAFSAGPGTVSIAPAKGDVIDGKFEIDECLGTGGMGTVFSATHVVTKKRVAIKWMLPAQSVKKEAVQRFIREAEAAGRVDHPNVVDVYDIGKHARGYYLVMELLRGESLSQLLAGKRVRSYTEAITLLMPVMRGVAAAHAAGVVHRDLKPANVFLCRGPDGSPREPKVLDFGISKLLPQQNQSEPYQTTDNTFLGTPSYVAPEQLRSNKRIDCRADVYALGVMLYELITGRLPFVAQGVSEMLVEITTGTPDPLTKHQAELPEEVNAAVMKAIAREPEDRYPDVRSLALALEPFAGGVRFDPTGSVPLMRPGLLPAAKQKRFKALWFVVAIVGGIVMAFAIWTRAEKQEERVPAAKPIVHQQPAPAAHKSRPRTGHRETAEVLRPATEGLAEESVGSGKPSPEDEDQSSSIPQGTESRAVQKSPSQTAVFTRHVLFVSRHRAGAKVTLECAGVRIQRYVPARAKVVASVPRDDCRVTCTGAGEPSCRIRLRATDETLKIF